MPSLFHPRFRPQIHNEFFNLPTAAGNDRHHQGKGNMVFCQFGLPDPILLKWVERIPRNGGNRPPGGTRWESWHRFAVMGRKTFFIRKTFFMIYRLFQVNGA